MHTIFQFRKHQKTMIFIFISALSTLGCPQLLPPETVEFVDLERYTGLWYEIARYDNPGDEDLVAVTAEYTLNDDGTLQILNRGLVGDLDGPCTSTEGIARVVDESNAKLKVRLTRPKIPCESFEYWIIDLGEYYAYSVVSDSRKNSLYILSRKPTIEASTYQDLIESLTERGFDPERIVRTPQFEEMPPPETVESVGLESYAGLWYEIARYDTPFDEDAVGVTAEYTLNDDGTVRVVNKGFVGGLDGTPTSIEGVARVVDPETNAKLAVTFDRPDIAGIEFDYWIIELDEDYEWAVVTNETRFVLYILSRTPALEDSVYEDILYRVVKKGFAKLKQFSPKLPND